MLFKFVNTVTVNTVRNTFYCYGVDKAVTVLTYITVNIAYIGLGLGLSNDNIIHIITIMLTGHEGNSM